MKGERDRDLFYSAEISVQLDQNKSGPDRKQAEVKMLPPEEKTIQIHLPTPCPTPELCLSFAFLCILLFFNYLLPFHNKLCKEKHHFLKGTVAWTVPTMQFKAEKTSGSGTEE